MEAVAVGKSDRMYEMTEEEKLGPFPHQVALGEKRPPTHTPPSAERPTLPHEQIRTDIREQGKTKSAVPEFHQPIKPL